MMGHDVGASPYGFRFFLGWTLVLAAGQSMLFLPACSTHAGESGREGTTLGTEIDRHDHVDGTIDAMIPHQKHVGPHMKWTALRPVNAADTQRADQIVQALRQAIEKYKDYRVAINDGFVLLHPERRPKHFHFANKQRRFQAKVRFDPTEPTALLYRKTGEDFELEGAMYTAPKALSEDQLNERIPLSVAQWHAHVNICLALDGSGRRLSRKRFGFRGTIASESECQQAGGRFVPQAGGWMIHVYPFEDTPGKIWTH